ncbi:hypothetical protein Tco_0912723 [Tanacetum coccineum]
MKHSYSNDDTSFSIDVIDEILEDFDALLDEGIKILHSIEGTTLKEKLFAKFDEFMALTAKENFESKSDTEEPPFEEITFNTDYKIKTSLKEPPTDLELKPLHDNLEYAFLEEPSFLPVILNMQEVVKKEIVKLLDTGIIYPIADIPWVSPIHGVPKKGGITFVTNEKDELVPTRTVTGWRVYIDYHKLNEATTKDPFPLPFMDQMLERLAGNKYFCFLDGFSEYFQIPFDSMDQEKITFTYPFGTYAYSSNWNLPYELMCDARDFAVAAVLEFNIEIKDKKGTENVAADHLSWNENDDTSDDSDVDDNFPGETLMEITTKDTPWFVDFENYLVGDVIPTGMTYHEKKKILL